MDLNTYTPGEALNVSLGKKGVLNVSDQTEYNGQFDIIQVISEAIFDTLAEESNAPLTGVTIPTGTILYGSFTKIALISGVIRAYGVLDA